MFKSKKQNIEQVLLNLGFVKLTRSYFLKEVIILHESQVESAITVLEFCGKMSFDPEIPTLRKKQIIELTQKIQKELFN